MIIPPLPHAAAMIYSDASFNFSPLLPQNSPEKTYFSFSVHLPKKKQLLLKLKAMAMETSFDFEIFL